MMRRVECTTETASKTLPTWDNLLRHARVGTSLAREQDNKTTDATKTERVCGQKERRIT